MTLFAWQKGITDEQINDVIKIQFQEAFLPPKAAAELEKYLEGETHHLKDHAHVKVRPKAT